jgi:nucleoid DNA-binding protein
MFNLSFSAMSLGSLALPVASSAHVRFADLPLFAQLNLQNLRVPAQRVDNARKPMSYWMRAAFIGDRWASYGGDDGAAGSGDVGAGGAESPDDDDEIMDALLMKIVADEGMEVLESPGASAAALPSSKRARRDVEGANLAETYKWSDVPLYVQIMLSAAGVEKAAFEESGKSCWHWLRKTWARAAMDTVMRKIMATATLSTGEPVSLEGFGFGTVLVCGSCAGIVRVAARCATQKEFARELAEEETLARRENGLKVMRNIEATATLSTGEAVSLEGFGFGTVFVCGSHAGIVRVAARCATQEEFARELAELEALTRREHGLAAVITVMNFIEATVTLSTGEAVSLEGFGFGTVFVCGSYAGIVRVAARCATQEEFARELAEEETLVRRENGLAAVITVMNSIEATVTLSTGAPVSLVGFGFGTVRLCGSRAGIADIAASCATQEEFARKLAAEDTRRRQVNARAAADARTAQRAVLRSVLFCGSGCVDDAHSPECVHWNGVAGAAAAGDRGALAAVSAELTRRGAAAAASRTR